MFIERLKRLNPSLVTDAVQLHQAGELRANTYLIDTTTMTANTRVIRAEADRLGLPSYAMAKQFGRNRDACDAVVDGGIESCVAVDIQCMEAVQRSRMGIGHVGHLVQPHRGTEDAVIAARPEVVSVFHEDIAERLGAAARRADGRAGGAAARGGAERPLLLRPRWRVPLDGIEDAARRIDAIDGLRVAGVVQLPGPAGRRARAAASCTTPNLETVVEAAERLRRAGFDIEQINAPGTTSSGALQLLADAGATHAEPGNGLHGTTPLMVFDDDAAGDPGDRLRLRGVALRR